MLITRTEIKKSVIYGGGRQVFVEQEGQNQPEIELNDANDIDLSHSGRKIARKRGQSKGGRVRAWVP